MSAGRRTSLLVNHDTNRIAGHARVEVGAGALHLREGRFSQATPPGREVAGLHTEGQPFKLSVGVNGRRELYRAPRRALLNGREQEVQTVLRRARLLEVSVVPARADPDATLT